MSIQHGKMNSSDHATVKVTSVYSSNSKYIQGIQADSRKAMQNYGMTQTQHSDPFSVVHKFQHANSLDKSEKLQAARAYRAEQRPYKDVSISTGLGLRASAQAASLEAKASYYESIAKYKNLTPRTVSADIVHGVDTAVRKVGVNANKAAGDDIGAKTAATAVSAAAASYASFRLAQKIAPTTIEVAKKAPHMVGKAADTIQKIAKSKIYIPSVAAAKVAAAAKNKVQTTVQAAKKTAAAVKKTATAAKNATVKTIRIVRGMSPAKVVKVTKKAIETIRKQGLKAALAGIKKSVNIGGRLAAKGFVKGITKARRVAIPKAMKLGGLATAGLGSKLAGSDDMMVQGLGNAVKGAKTAVSVGKTATKATVKTAKTAVKGGVKTAKTTVKAIKYIKSNGLKKSLAKAFQKGGRSIVNMAINAVRSLGTKVLVPLILIAVTLDIFMTVVGGGGSIIVSMFSGVFSIFDEFGEAEEIEVEGYVDSCIVAEDGSGLRSDFVNQVVNMANDEMLKHDNPVNNMTVSRDDGNGSVSGYLKLEEVEDHINQKEYKAITADEISNLFYSKDDIVKLIEPFFQATMFTEYEMYDKVPTNINAQNEVADLFWSMVGTEPHEPQTNYCDYPASCGSVHATDSCMNYKIEYHTDNEFHCATCDTIKYYCNGHQQSHTEQYYSCNGHQQSVCKGHTFKDGTITKTIYHTRYTITEYAPTGDDKYLYDDYKIDGEYNGFYSCQKKCAEDGTYFEVSQVSHGDPITEGCWDYTIRTNTVEDENTKCNGGLAMNTPCSNCRREVHCSGHRVCKGHVKENMEIGLNGIYEILHYRFIPAITKARYDEQMYRADYYYDMNRVGAEDAYHDAQDACSTLLENYDILLEILAENESGTRPMDAKELSKIEWYDSTRAGNDVVSSKALSAFKNQVDSETYWGKTSGGAQSDYFTDWNASFVWYIMSNSGSRGHWYIGDSGLTCSDTDIMSITSKLETSYHWQPNTYRNIAEGDVVVMSYNLGIVMGRDADYIYVIEGNNGDAVRLMRYPLDSYFIKGYYLMS